MQNLVGIGIADAAKKARIGERALERVVGRLKRAGEIGRRRMQHVDSSGIELAQAFLAGRQMKCRAMLGAGFGELQDTRRKFETRQGVLTGCLGARLAPVQATRDHQVQHHPDVAIEPDCDALSAEAPHLAYRTPFPPRKRGGATDRSRNGPRINAR